MAIPNIGVLLKELKTNDYITVGDHTVTKIAENSFSIRAKASPGSVIFSSQDQAIHTLETTYPANVPLSHVTYNPATNYANSGVYPMSTDVTKATYAPAGRNPVEIVRGDTLTLDQTQDNWTVQRIVPNGTGGNNTGVTQIQLSRGNQTTWVDLGNGRHEIPGGSVHPISDFSLQTSKGFVPLDSPVVTGTSTRTTPAASYVSGSDRGLDPTTLKRIDGLNGQYNAQGKLEGIPIIDERTGQQTGSVVRKLRSDGSGSDYFVVDQRGGNPDTATWTKVGDNSVDATRAADNFSRTGNPGLTTVNPNNHNYVSDPNGLVEQAKANGSVKVIGEDTNLYNNKVYSDAQLRAEFANTNSITRTTQEQAAAYNRNLTAINHTHTNDYITVKNGNGVEVNVYRDGGDGKYHVYRGGDEKWHQIDSRGFDTAEQTNDFVAKLNNDHINGAYYKGHSFDLDNDNNIQGLDAKGNEVFTGPDAWLKHGKADGIITDVLVDAEGTSSYKVGREWLNEKDAQRAVLKQDTLDAAFEHRTNFYDKTHKYVDGIPENDYVTFDTVNGNKVNVYRNSDGSFDVYNEDWSRQLNSESFDVAKDANVFSNDLTKKQVSLADSDYLSYSPGSDGKLHSYDVKGMTLSSIAANEPHSMDFGKGNAVDIYRYDGANEGIYDVYTKSGKLIAHGTEEEVTAAFRRELETVEGGGKFGDSAKGEKGGKGSKDGKGQKDEKGGEDGAEGEGREKSLAEKIYGNPVVATGLAVMSGYGIFKGFEAMGEKFDPMAALGSVMGLMSFASSASQMFKSWGIEGNTNMYVMLAIAGIAIAGYLWGRFKPKENKLDTTTGDADKTTVTAGKEIVAGEPLPPRWFDKLSPNLFTITAASALMVGFGLNLGIDGKVSDYISLPASKLQTVRDSLDASVGGGKLGSLATSVLGKAFIRKSENNGITPDKLVYVVRESAADAKNPEKYGVAMMSLDYKGKYVSQKSPNTSYTDIYERNESGAIVTTSNGNKALAEVQALAEAAAAAEAAKTAQAAALAGGASGK